MTNKRDFLTLSDVTREEWPAVWARAAELKAARKARRRIDTLAGRCLALVLEKASTRTRVSFEVGMFDLGGHTVVLATQGSQIARGEPIEDTARVLAGYCDAIALRTFGQARVEAMARWASVPVVNALSDEHHPCQVASDLFTVLEHRGRIDGLRYAWVGDGNNMAHSWIEAAGLFGLDLILACPEGYRPSPQIVEVALDRQRALGTGRITLTSDPAEAVRSADVVSTDVWASMGQEEEAEQRRRAFAGYHIDARLLATASTEVVFLHCLPAHRGEEVSGDVLDRPGCAVWPQAENRLHVQKALLELLLTGR